MELDGRGDGNIIFKGSSEDELDFFGIKRLFLISLRDWEKENSEEQERNNDLDFNIREITWDIKIQKFSKKFKSCGVVGQQASYIKQAG